MPLFEEADYGIVGHKRDGVLYDFDVYVIHDRQLWHVHQKADEDVALGVGFGD